MIKEEIRVFFTALMFYTRIPCPSWVDHSPEYINKSTRYFSAIGVIVGAIGALVFTLSAQLFSQSISILLSMIATIWVTGAFHEDGFADVLDGFGGGWTKEQKLTIMKDSRLGTYGTVGLILILLLKYQAIHELPIHFIPFSIISAHTFSRFFASTLITYLPHVTSEGSKTKPVADGMPARSVILSFVIALPTLLLFRNWIIITVIPILLLFSFYMAYKFRKNIGGYTGDCLGATQQICELGFYLSSVLIWNYWL
ncbi:MAG: adenosylcobinamide-GDP ribazoletransferase [Bacteroidota bacterium]